MQEKNYSLKDLLEKHDHRQIFTGWSGAEAYYLPGLAAYLKIAPLESLSDLAREKEVLQWLAEKLEGELAVPKVLGFEKTDDRQFILISEIKGQAVSDLVAANRHDMAAVEDCVQKTAVAMRQIHNVPIAGCPFRQDIDTKLAAARENIRRGFVDESDFDREHQGRAAAEIYDELAQTKPLREDLVFTHGDFCLPNFMIQGGEISGFIDFDRAGIADRYQDIALFLRSFARNIEIPMEIKETFCEAYGIETLDERKLYYYRLLDELF